MQKRYSLINILILLPLILLTAYGCAGFPDSFRHFVDLSASFSPDGKNLAILSQRDGPEQFAIYLTDCDGKQAQLITKDVTWYPTPTITSDNKSIIYFSRDRSKALKIDTETRHISQLSVLKTGRHSRHISTNGKYIVLTAITENVNPALIVIDTTTNSIKNIDRIRFDYELRAVSLSMDGSRIVFYHKDDIYMYDLENEKVECLAKEFLDQLHEKRNKSENRAPPVLSADNKKVLFATRHTIFTLDIAKKQYKKIFQYPKGYDLDIINLSFSPNNRFITFCAIGFYRGDYISEFNIYDTTTGITKRLDGFTAFYTFSPDSNYIVYLLGRSKKEQSGLYKININNLEREYISPPVSIKHGGK